MVWSARRCGPTPSRRADSDLGSPRRNPADALTGVALAWQDTYHEHAPADLETRLVAVPAEQFARPVPPPEVDDQSLPDKEPNKLPLEFSMVPTGQG